VHADSMLTAPGQAYPLLQQAVDDAILVGAAEALGAMAALMDVSAQYISTRQQFRAPLASFQVLRHKMADMTIAIKGAECLFEALVAELNREGRLPTAKLSVLKAKMGTTGRLIGSAAVQLHGGIGTTGELNVGHYLKRLVALNVHFGNVDHHLKKVWQAVA
jgi:alkylation response protein AidB-like acyl-CoA dehydrogenase